MSKFVLTGESLNVNKKMQHVKNIAVIMIVTRF